MGIWARSNRGTPLLIMTPGQNKCELSIGHLRRDIKWRTSTKGSSRKLWAYWGNLCALIKQLTSANDPSFRGCTAYEMVHGYTPDITMLNMHDWYDFIWWFDFKDKITKLGRWLGPCGKDVGGGDCHYILSDTTKVHVSNSTTPIEEHEWRKEDLIMQILSFKTCRNICRRLSWGLCVCLQRGFTFRIPAHLERKDWQMIPHIFSPSLMKSQLL